MTNVAVHTSKAIFTPKRFVVQSYKMFNIKKNPIVLNGTNCNTPQALHKKAL